MSVESASYISQLDATRPNSSDLKSEGDNHLRLLKSTLQATFPNITGAVTPTHTELNYVDGVTSSIQDQLDRTLKQSGGSAISALPSAATRATKVLSFDGSGNPRTTIAETDLAAAVTAAANAATSETNAASSASAAASSASTASTQATNAASSASSASSSASSAASVYDAFDDRYLGDKASNPTVDNDGNALLTGALYWNTTTPGMRVYNGSAWVSVADTAISDAAAASASAASSSASAASTSASNASTSASNASTSASSAATSASTATTKASEANASAIAAAASAASISGGPVTSVNGETGVVTLVKGDIGLGNVDNTSNATERAATATLTNKTIAGATFTDGYTEETATANTSTAYTISLANGSLQFLTLTGNCTYTFPTPAAGKSFMLVQKQDGTGSRTVTWPASVKWPGGTAPTITSAANKVDKFVFTAIDGSSWLGSVAGLNYTA